MKDRIEDTSGWSLPFVVESGSIAESLLTSHMFRQPPKSSPKLAVAALASPSCPRMHER